MSIRFTAQATPCVSCHRGGRFSYWDASLGCWIENDTMVPQHVLDALPDDERQRVMRALTAVGTVSA